MEREKPRYDVRMDTTMSGEHLIHILLGGLPIKGSPVAFKVHDAQPDPAHSQLTGPSSNEKLYSSATEEVQCSAIGPPRYSLQHELVTRPLPDDSLLASLFRMLIFVV